MGESCTAVDQMNVMKKINDLSLPIVRMESLTPTKILIVFESDKITAESWDLSSPLWDLFDSVEM